MTTETTNNETVQFRPASVLKLLAWILGFLILADIAINLLFAYPQNNQTEPNTLQYYFDYGRSTEGKLRRMVSQQAGTEAPIAQDGWLGALQKSADAQPQRTPDITVYGSSFAERVGKAAIALAPQLEINVIGAPAAPLSWSYAAFKEDIQAVAPDVAVLTILSQGLGQLAAMSGATANFAVPYPYTQPHYSLASANETRSLRAIKPAIDTLPGMRSALFNDEQRWQEWVTQLRRHDPYFHPLLFYAGWADHSALLRILRRGFWIWHRRQVEAGLYSADGFNSEHPVTEVAKALVARFVTDARQRGILPVIYLVNNYGMDSHLFDLLARELDALDVAYVSSHTDIDPSDPRAYLPDSHFRPDLDKLMAKKILSKIDQNRMR